MPTLEATAERAERHVTTWLERAAAWTSTAIDLARVAVQAQAARMQVARLMRARRRELALLGAATYEQDTQMVAEARARVSHVDAEIDALRRVTEARLASARARMGRRQRASARTEVTQTDPAQTSGESPLDPETR